MSESDDREGLNVELTSEWDVHVGEFTFTMSSSRMGDFARAVQNAPCWVPLGANLIWVAGNVVINPHVENIDPYRVRYWIVPEEGKGPEFADVLDEFLAGGEPISVEEGRSSD